MYYSKGLSEIIKSICKMLGLSEANFSFNDYMLVTAYENFLLKSSVFQKNNFKDEICFIDLEHFKKIAPLFYEMKQSFFLQNSLLLEERIATGFFSNAIQILAAKSQTIYRLASFLIKVVLINQLSSNEMTHQIMGLSCFDFKDHYIKQDFIEFIFYETIRMIILIDNQNVPHLLYRDEMIEPKMSADFVFNSYIIGVEMLAFRKEMGWFNMANHAQGTSTQIIKKCCSLQKKLLKHIHLFSARGKSMLEDAIVLFEQLRVL